MTLSCSLVKSTIVAALGGLLFGFDTAVIAGTMEALTREYDLSPGSLGFTVASALVGTIVGALLASYPGDRLGRRDSLRIMAVLYFVSAVGCAFAWNWSSLVLFRFIGGLGIGGSSVRGFSRASTGCRSSSPSRSRCSTSSRASTRSCTT